MRLTTSTLFSFQKKPNSLSVNDFRPISLCNFLSKIITKIMTLILKPLLNLILSSSQFGFVEGRFGIDNIIICQEVLYSFKLKKGVVGWLMAKLDLNKAYDKLEWPFLQSCLRHLGFHEIWVKRILAYVTTSSFSILINGVRSPPFVVSRGLRQGDPLCPIFLPSV